MEKLSSPMSLSCSFLSQPLSHSASPNLVHLTVVWFLRLIQQLSYFYYILRFDRNFCTVATVTMAEEIRNTSVQRQSLCHFVNQNPVDLGFTELNDLHNRLVYPHVTKVLSMVSHCRIVYKYYKNTVFSVTKSSLNCLKIEFYLK